MQNGPTETNAALEFAVNILKVGYVPLLFQSNLIYIMSRLYIPKRIVCMLKVENILVIGHSCCAGIQSLMSMDDNATDSRFHFLELLSILHICFFWFVIVFRSVIDNLFFYSSFVHKWVVNAKDAKLRTKAAAAHLNFDQQCKHCEKVLIFLLQIRTTQSLFDLYNGTFRLESANFFISSYAKLKLFIKILLFLLCYCIELV